MEDRPFQEINNKIDMIIRLLAQSLVKDLKYQKEKIIMLSSIGYKPAEIYKFLCTTSNTVRVRLSEARKEGLI